MNRTNSEIKDLLERNFGAKGSHLSRRRVKIYLRISWMKMDPSLPSPRKFMLIINFRGCISLIVFEENVYGTSNRWRNFFSIKLWEKEEIWNWDFSLESIKDLKIFNLRNEIQRVPKVRIYFTIFDYLIIWCIWDLNKRFTRSIYPSWLKVWLEKGIIINLEKHYIFIRYRKT